MKVKGSLIFIIMVLISVSVCSKNPVILLADASGTFPQPLYFELAGSFSFEGYYISLHLKPDGTFMKIDARIDYEGPPELVAEREERAWNEAIKGTYVYNNISHEIRLMYEWEGKSVMEIFPLIAVHRSVDEGFRLYLPVATFVREEHVPFKRMKSGALCTYISKFVEGKELEGYVKCMEPCDDGRRLIILEEKIAANSVDKTIWEYTLSPPLPFDRLEKLDGFYEATATVSCSPFTDYPGALVHISLRMFNDVILYESSIEGID